jgi:hypothetical protein
MSNFVETHSADEIIDKAWTFVPKGIPHTKDELWNFKYGMDEASKKKDLSDITKFRIKEGYDYIKKWKKRRFIGSYWLLAISLLTIIWMGYKFYTRYMAGVPLLEFSDAGGIEAIFANIFGAFYLVGFLTYFWSQRAPVWMIQANGLKKGDKLMSDALDPTPVKNAAYTEIAGTTYFDKSGAPVDRYGNRKYLKSDSGILLIAVLLVFKYLTLPFFTFAGYFRYYVFYI